MRTLDTSGWSHRFADLLDPPIESAVTLGQAVRDPQLLGADIRWWPQQLELLDSLQPGLHVWAIGRQAGKTSMAAAAAIHNALYRPDLDEMLPRSRIRYVLIAGAGRDQSYEVIKVTGGLLDQIDPDRLPVRHMERLAGSISFELNSGRRTCIRAMPTWGRAIRGLSASMAILDEFAHVAQTEGQGADRQVFAALTPAIRVFGPQAIRLLISTPAGTAGRFFELFEQAAAGELASARAVQAATWEIVPDLDTAWLDGQRAELGEALYAQEYGAEFVEGGGSFFTDLHSILWADGPAFPEEALHWCCAVDPAFHADGFGYAVVGPSRNEPGRLLVGPVGAIKPHGDARSFDARRGREDATLEAVWEQIAPYAPSKLITDQHQASAIEAYFGRRGIPVEVINVTGAIHTAAFVTLRARLTDGSVRCPREPQLFAELRRIRAKDGERVYLPRYGDSHCDAAMALALAVHSAETVSIAPQLVKGTTPRRHQTPSWWGKDRYGSSPFD